MCESASLRMCESSSVRVCKCTSVVAAAVATSIVSVFPEKSNKNINSERNGFRMPCL